MNAQSNSIENAFIRCGIPYRIIGGHRFYERKEIRDAIAYLTVINNPDDNVRLRRIINEPKRGIGDTTLNNVAAIAAELGVSMYEIVKTADEYANLSRASARLLGFADLLEELRMALDKMTLAEVFELAMQKSGYYDSLALDKDTYTDRIANLNELTSNLVRYSENNQEGDLNGFLEEIALMSDIDNYNSESDTVVMMTLHSSKGLEFPVVFISGMEEGIFPGQQSIYSQTELEEERRLAYVGITRAKKNLYLINTRSRMLFGSTVYNMQSRFINEIPESLIELKGLYITQTTRPSRSFAGEPNKASVNRGFSASTRNKTTNVYRAGDTVVHKIFGEGMVISVLPMGNDSMLEIAFKKVGTKKLMANYSKLEIQK
jgi:DNA helicase-2/ATP-dependent DNA helicase PcrA